MRSAGSWLLVITIFCTYEQCRGRSCGGGCGSQLCADINVGILVPTFVTNCDPCRCRRTGPECRSPCFSRSPDSGGGKKPEDSGGSNPLVSGTRPEDLNPGDGVCVESEWLERQGLLKMHSKDKNAKVLCPEGLPCGTPSHILTVEGLPVTYARLCESEHCQFKISRVNTFVLTADTPLGIDSPGRPDVRITPFALTGWSLVDMLQMRLARICSSETCEHRLSVKAIRMYQALEHLLSRYEEWHGKLLKYSSLLLGLIGLGLTINNTVAILHMGSASGPKRQKA